MFSLFFLSAQKPLTKAFTLGEQGEIIKHSYPTVKNFTSHVEQIDTLKDMYDAVVKHSKLNRCLIKGKLKDTLSNEPRANFTQSNDQTQWALIDLDGSPYKTAEEFMQAHEVLRNLSYIVQYSSSYGIFNDGRLSCHIFIMLDAAVQAPLLKTWLMSLNLASAVDREALTLSRTGAMLHYPVDVSTCQNDKLIYIAPPMLGKGVKCSVTNAERIQYINKKQKALTTKFIFDLKPEIIKKECREILNDLRKEAGYQPLSRQTKWVGEYEVQPKPGEARLTGIRVGDEFVHMNLNGGDSWAYYHPINNFELIHSFKDDVAYVTKELLPQYYKECVARRAEENASPTEDGEMLLAFRDFKSSAYWNGTWNPETNDLNIVRAKDTTQLSHFLMSKGREMGEYVPIWDIQFEPNKNYIVDEENHKINTYVPSPYMAVQHKMPKDWKTACPTIYKVLISAISGNKDDELLEHFLNYIAVIYQKRVKLITAWILTGIEGTGKGVLVERILRPTLGAKYVRVKRGTELEEKYNGWAEGALLGYIDEIHVGSSTRAEAIMADLRNMITEPTMTVRNMRESAYEIQNYINIIASSNKPDPVVISDNDRRFNIGVFQDQKLTGVTQHVLDHVLPKELDTFVNYLMCREIDVDKANTVMHTATRQNVIEASRSSLDELGIYLRKGQLEKLWDSMPDLNLVAELHNNYSATASAYANIVKREVINVHKTCNYTPTGALKTKAPKGTLYCRSKLTRDELMVVFEHCVGNMPTTPNKFTSLLRHRGINIEPVLVGDKTMRGLYVEWTISEAKLNEIVRELDAKPDLKVVGTIKKAKVAA